ncbi:MAG: molybdopterin oxidoreductase [Alphaproteobacteria bacterium]|nr:molybdopterin oxidoreductase [Alphaproteobacteria bacterium]
MARLVFRRIEQPGREYWAGLGVLAVLAMVGLWAAHVMELEGHVVTGMTNRVVWGLPHVFAVFLIVAASGALNAASIASVFGQADYKPYARLSGLIAIALLAGGLAVLVLDLGRPDRLIVAMTRYNFASIFAWNIFLYVGFVAIVAAYLVAMMDRELGRSDRWSKPIGWLAFLWRLVLTTGTGSIFGWLVAREAYDAAVLAPLFIASSLALGTAASIPILAACGRALGEPLLADDMLSRWQRLLAIFVAATLYFTALHHLTNLYASAHHGIERFLLLEGGGITQLFWIGQVGIGGVLPLALLLLSAPTMARLNLAAIMVLVGGLAQFYVVIIGGQVYPQTLFPGMEITSSFHDGEIAPYRASFYELALGLGGAAFALLLIGIGAALLPFLPRHPAR